MFLSIEIEESEATSRLLSEKTVYLNNNKVNELILNSNWNEVMHQTSSQTMFNKLHSIMSQIYERSTVVARHRKQRKPYPWLTNEVIQLCNKRDTLYKRWKNNAHDIQREREYKAFRNKVNKVLIKSKNQYYKDLFKENASNTKRTWEVINEVIGRKKPTTDNKITVYFKDSSETVANNFALDFQQSVNNTIHHCDHTYLNETHCSINSTIYVEKASELEIYNIINSLKTNKSLGADGIRPMDIKNHADIFAPLITKLVNEIIFKADIPPLLKVSIIKPIFKSGKKADYNNYRPISILRVIEKVMEEIIVRRTTDFINKNKLLHKNQYGFQAGKGINKLLGDFSHVLNKSRSEHRHSLILFIDFKKAFDTLDHKRILMKAEQMGLRGIYMKWLSNYLNDRKYKVKINNTYSEIIDTTHGVPQGSKLGPLLYLIYTNDLLSLLNNSSTFAYADDTAVIVTNKSLISAQRIMQQEFDTLSKWAHDNGLILNVNKTKLMHIRPGNSSNTSTIIFYNQFNCQSQTRQTIPIETVETMKYLGIIVDSQLKWKQQIELVQKKLRKTSFALYHWKNCSNTGVLKQVYFSLAESYIRFGITAWGTSTHCKQLEKSQKRLIKLIPIEDKSIFLKVENIFKLTMINTYFNSKEYLKKIDHNQCTRNKSSGKYKVARFYNSFGKFTLPVILPTIFNALPENLTRIQCNHLRKTQLKNYFFSINSYNNQ